MAGVAVNQPLHRRRHHTVTHRVKDMGGDRTIELSFLSTRCVRRERPNLATVLDPTLKLH